MTNNLTHYLRQWKLSDPQPLAQSERGDLYTAYRNNEKVVYSPIPAANACSMATFSITTSVIILNGAGWLMTPKASTANGYTIPLTPFATLPPPGSGSCPKDAGWICPNF
jgi:hypothetical protein